MYSDKFLLKYLDILKDITPICKEQFTQGELATILETNRTTINQFFSGKIIRVDLLEQVLGLCGKELELYVG
jgi:predicted XRE-type DNA-binding protein